MISELNVMTQNIHSLWRGYKKYTLSATKREKMNIGFVLWIDYFPRTLKNVHLKILN